MKFTKIKTFVTLALFAPVFAAAAPLEGTFSYYADGHDIKTVLSSFAHGQGMTAEFDKGVKGRVSGQFTRVPAEDFMNAMTEAYGIGYYTLGETITFYELDDTRKDFIMAPGGTTDDLIVSLTHSGYLSAELPIHVNPEGNMLTVTGPQSYIDQLKNAAAAYLAVQKEKIVMRVFPVKYAWADDIQLNNMDKTITVPGIASILRGIVMGQSVAGETVSKEKSTGSNVPSVGIPGLSLRKSQEAPKPASASPVTAGSISIMADPRVNAVLVSDALYRMPYYEDVISQLDKPVELVEIHAAIVDIDTNASRELGINFSGKGVDGHWESGGTMGSSNKGGFDSNGKPIISAVTGTSGALLSTIYTHGSDVFMARISALESENAAKMLGRPSVLTVDNVQAVLENTTTYYIPLQGKEAVDLFKVESGTVLRVTPHIIHDNEKTSIKLAVAVQDDQSDAAGGYQSVGDDNSASLTVSPIKQTKITTQAMVDAGQSLLIGGYYYEQKSDGTSGVPLLKDIPLVGALFRSKSKSGRQMERLILITPRIVSLGHDNVPDRLNDAGFARSATQGDYDIPALPADTKEEQ